jgi:hypothetical protein
MLDNNEKYISQVRVISKIRRDIKEIVTQIQQEFGP